MNVSTRNQLSGKIASVVKGVVNSEVVLNIAGATKITAIITNGAAEKLGLKEGIEASALIKASSVILGTGIKAISTRNLLTGKIVKISDGAVNAEVVVEVAEGVTITSIITEGSVKKLGLKVGDEVNAIFKASTVILATL